MATLDIEALGARVRKATAANSDGHPAVAVRQFQRVLRVLDDVVDPPAEVLALQSRAVLGLATSAFEVGGDVDSALVLLDRAEELAERAGAGQLSAGVRNNRALVLLRSGETQSAMAAFDDAARLLDVAEPFDQCCILLNRGALHLEHGSLEPAREDLARCADLAASAGERLLEFKARHNLGYVEFLAGNLPRALSDMAAAAAIDPGGPRPIALLDQARVLREAGLGREALAVLGEAARLFARDRLPQDLAETELAKAECELVGDNPTRARAHAVSARRVFRRRGNQRWERKADLLVLQSQIDQARRLAATERHRAFVLLARRCAEVSQVCRHEGRLELARTATLLEIDCLLASDATDLRDPRAAMALRLRRDDSLSVRLQIRQLRARAAAAAADHGRARREARTGLDELAAYQSGLGSLDLRTASAVHGVELARIDLALSVHRGRPAEVFASIERARATSARLAPVRPPADHVTAALLAELRRVEETAREVAGSAAKAGEQGRLRDRVAQLQREVIARSWHREADSTVARVSELSRVRAALDASGAAMVCYVAHRGQWVACLIDGRRLEVHQLAPVARVDELSRRLHADLDALALPGLPTAVRAAALASLNAGLATADALLLGPLRVGDRPLVLSPGGLLAVLPWSALPSRRGLPLVVAPSATQWERGTRRGQWEWGTRRGRAAGPVDQGVAPTATPRVAVIAGPGLTRADQEAEGVAASWGAAQLAVGDAARTTTLGRMLAADVDVVHVAAHGVHQVESPLFSSIRLSDGPLFAYELDPVAGMAGLVVLSACELGLSTIRPGDEALGLTSVLLRLGATSVVAGVARVGDALAADVMLGMHQRLAAGADVATALAESAAASDHDVPPPFLCFGGSWSV